MASLVSSVGLVSSPCDSRISDVNVRRLQHLGLGLGLGQSLAIAPSFRGRGALRLASVRRRAGGDDDEPAQSDTGSKKFDDTVDEIQQALGKSFGGPLWFAVLLTLLALFGGGYVYLIYNYADFSDIPILNGPRDL